MVEIVGWAVLVAFLAVGVTTVQLWWRQRTISTGLVAVAFASLAAALLGNRLLPEDPSGALVVVDAATSVLVVAFPYLLLSFVVSLEPLVGWWRAVRGMVTVVVVGLMAAVAWGVAREGEPEWWPWLVLAVLALWTGLVAWVVWRLVAASRGQHRLARRRMRTMAVGAAMLNVALVIAGLGETPSTEVIGQSVAVFGAVTFMLTFAPPKLMQVIWRQAEEEAFWHTAAQLAASTSREQTVGQLLPHFSRLVGGREVLFVDHDGEEWAVGVDGQLIEQVRRHIDRASAEHDDPPTDVVVLTLASGWVGVVTNPYTPLFGRDELELLERLGTLMDLALSRVEMSITTRVLSAFEQALVPEVDPPEGLQVASRYQPGAERLRLGGDFLDVISIDDDVAGFVVGDVSGHGVQEAAFAVGLHAGWRTLATVDPRGPAGWLAALDEQFFRWHPERIATCLTGRVDVPGGRVTFSSAGHHPPIVVGGGARTVDPQPDLVLGVDRRQPRHEHTITLAHGQGLLVYTDGLIEQPRPDGRGRWSEADLLAWLAGRPDVDDIDLDELLADFGDGEFDDDVAVMLLRIEPGPEQPLDRDALRAAISDGRD